MSIVKELLMKVGEPSSTMKGKTFKLKGAAW